jgi:cytochrome c oxidase subunit 2
VLARLLAALTLTAALLSACGGSSSGAGAGSSLVATGQKLYNSQGCSACHTIDGSLNTGPTWKGLYLSRVHLTSGKTIVATAAYLQKHIVDPNAMTVADFPGDVMAEAISGDDLAHRPAEVRALVAYIESLK